MSRDLNHNAYILSLLFSSSKLRGEGEGTKNGFLHWERQSKFSFLLFYLRSLPIALFVWAPKLGRWGFCCWRAIKVSPPCPSSHGAMNQGDYNLLAFFYSSSILLTIHSSNLPAILAAPEEKWVLSIPPRDS